ncbi:MAG: hypothetical protein HWN66_12960 [Candidatus Helarchaeota archaeon]|nr:hypothetical protein [Candidatus Helarchaeota archaeon]
MSYRITGKVTEKETGKGIPDLQVKGWDKDLSNLDELLGTARTDEKGKFLIEYTEEAFDEWGIDEKPDIFLVISNQKGAIIYTSEAAVRVNAGKEERFDIQISRDLLKQEPDISYEEFMERFKEQLE